MNVKMDRAGRIVLPKLVRQKLGLKNGGTLIVEEAPDAVTLRPMRHGTKFADEHGVLVYIGKVPKGINWDKLLDEEREARLRELWER